MSPFNAAMSRLRTVRYQRSQARHARWRVDLEQQPAAARIDRRLEQHGGRAGAAIAASAPRLRAILAAGDLPRAGRAPGSSGHVD